MVAMSTVAPIHVVALIVAGGHGPELLELVDAPLGGVALLVPLRVEVRWPATAGALRAPVGVLVGLTRDGRLDPATAQVAPIPAGGVRLVGQHPLRAHPRPAGSGSRHPDAPQNRDELRAVAALPGRQHNR